MLRLLQLERPYGLVSRAFQINLKVSRCWRTKALMLKLASSGRWCYFIQHASIPLGPSGSKNLNLKMWKVFFLLGVLKNHFILLLLTQWLLKYDWSKILNYVTKYLVKVIWTRWPKITMTTFNVRVTYTKHTYMKLHACAARTLVSIILSSHLVTVSGLVWTVKLVFQFTRPSTLISDKM